MTQIALVRTQDRKAGTEAALDLLGVQAFQSKRLFLKPNFNSADPPPGSTHAETLRTLVSWLQAKGAEKITVGDRSGMGSTRDVMRNKGIFTMAKELGFDTVVFDELTADDWEMHNPPHTHWRTGFAVARPILEAEGVVQTCCLKTHRFGGHFTMSLKNSVGLVAKQIPGKKHNFMNELHLSPNQRSMIAEINLAYKPDLILLDAVEAFANKGPDRGKLIHPQVMVAGTDRVAVDAVGVALLRLFGTTRAVSRGAIFSQDQIARAVDLKLGVDAPGKIEFLTQDQESKDMVSQVKDILLAE